MKDLFLKFPSIENHYQAGTIARWVNHHPTLATDNFIVTEKLDGANFQIIITAEGFEFASRNQMLGIDSNFFDWQRVVLKGEDRLLYQLQSYLLLNNLDSIHVYGELYGQGVQKRIDYGSGKYFRVFESRFNGVTQPPATTIEMLESIGMASKFVPILGTVVGLQGALDWELPEGAEGVVIAPYTKVYEKAEGQTFRLKKKSKAFNDQMKVKTGKTPVLFEASDDYKRVYAIWESYFSENRLADLFSKEGRIQECREFGKYLKAMAADVKADFLEDHRDDFINLTQQEKNQLLKSAPKLTLPMLKEALNQ